MKKIISLFLISGLLFTILPANLYAEERNIISYEEYSSALIEKFAEHGRDLEMEPTNDFVYTEEILEQELIKAEQYLAKPMNIECTNSDAEIIDEKNSGIMPANMLGTVTCSKQTAVLFTDSVVPTAIGQVKTTATITLDYQRDYVASGARPILEMTSAVNMDDYVKLNSYTATTDNSASSKEKRYIVYTINAQFKLDYSVIGATAWEKVDKTFVVMFYPFK